MRFAHRRAVMLGFNRANHRPIAEHEADGEIDRIYHEIRQTLRVTGVNLAFRTWAGQERFLPVFWTAFAPNVETVAFERCADRLRESAVKGAEAIGKLDIAGRVRLGESQRWQLVRSLDLYNYLNPKILLIASAMRLVFDGEPIGARRSDGNGELERIELGAPEDMMPMEMVAEDPDDRRIRELFDDIRKTMSIHDLNSDYRTLALWPDYLTAAWERLKPMLKRERYIAACERLIDESRSLVRMFPHPVPLTRARITEAGADAEEIGRITTQIERVVPQLMINMELLSLDFKPAEELMRSPYPPQVRRAQGGVS